MQAALERAREIIIKMKEKGTIHKTITEAHKEIMYLRALADAADETFGARGKIFPWDKPGNVK